MYGILLRHLFYYISCEQSVMEFLMADVNIFVGVLNNEYFVRQTF